MTSTRMVLLSTYYNDARMYYGDRSMAKSKLRMEQETAMDTWAHKYTAAHRRHLRKVGGGNASEGVRVLIERDMQGFTEKRSGPVDRRRKKK